MRFAATAAALLLISIGWMPPAGAIEPGAPEQLIEPEAAVGIKLRQSLLSSNERADRLTSAQRKSIDRFYQERGNTPIWTDGVGLLPSAFAVMDEIRKADDWGLDAKSYTLPLISKQEGALVAIDRLVEAERLLSVAVARYAAEAAAGRVDPARYTGMVERAVTPPDPYDVLSQIILSKDPSEFLLKFQPSHPQFEALRLKLAELRKQAAGVSTEAFIEIPPGPLLKPGMKHPDVALLRQRLNVPLAAGADAFDTDVYDEFLEEAVRNYQVNSGLKPDGIVGKNMRASLNGAKPASPTAQIERVLANMERWRWLPRDLGPLYIWNNIPEFLTRVVKDGAPIYEERIVVGKPNTPTPVFSDEMEYVEFHPFWNVPDSIKKNELLPGLISGRDPLTRQGLVAKYKGRTVDPYSVDWSTVDIRRFHIYQPPGRGNALGVIKFMFPNKHDVYMHDTPSKSLFNSSVRAFSHGCMRVRNPLKFAEVVLGEGLGWTRREIDRQLAKGQNQQVPFAHKIPVHITYFTAYVDGTGALAFRSDLYGHDKRLIAALNGAEPLFAETMSDGDVTGDIAEIPVLPKKRKKTQFVVNEDDPAVIVGKKKKRRLDNNVSRR
ncbi:MAG: L,D-transpeptidase family protein [Hyphomicrobiaceae bacterium]